MLARRLLDYKKVLQYETIIIAGVIIATLSLLNVLGITNISSDFFLTLAGVGLIIEGILERSKLKKEYRVLIKRDKGFWRRKTKKWSRP